MELPSRFNHTCNCCLNSAAENFCISFFALYAVVLVVFVTFTGIFFYSKSKGLSREKKEESIVGESNRSFDSHST
jgi:hypothetical protein